jgi:hypothetical protein
MLGGSFCDQAQLRPIELDRCIEVVGVGLLLIGRMNSIKYICCQTAKFKLKSTLEPD